ncbi:MAG: universal stress protein, partial [Chloroflexi bacterium]|nr:universal stress protein [Chloroflexota bacterium]
MSDYIESYRSAREDFRHARREAAIQGIVARFTGKSTELLSYEDVSQKLKAVGSAHRGLKEIPIEKIIGSVGRYTDFTRSFLPRLDSDESRWAHVM